MGRYFGSSTSPRNTEGGILLFPTLFRKAIPSYFRTGQGSFSRIIWHRPEEGSAARERSGRESYGCSR